MPKPPAASLSTLRAAMLSKRVIQFWYYGDEVEAEPHALLQAQRTGAFVLAACREPEGAWEFYRFAEMRGLELTSKAVVTRFDIPAHVPKGWGEPVKKRKRSLEDA